MSMILNVELDYSFDGKVKELSQAQRDSMRVNVMCLKDLKDPVEGEKYYSSGIYGKLLVTETEFEFLKNLGIDVNIKNFKNNYVPREHDNGAKYHFHLPNISLLMFDEVTWLEDCCTENLQEKLDQGWRMIAVCPPNGTRRPDYILGRGKK